MAAEVSITLDRTVEALGDGEVVSLGGDETAFRLYSHPANPIVRPEDLGLTWQEDGEQHVGAVFNGGAELLGDRVVLTPRCQERYRRTAQPGDERADKPNGGPLPFEGYVPAICPLISDDGVRFSRLACPEIRGDGTDHRDFTYGIEDVRIIRRDTGYVLVGCGKVTPPFSRPSGDCIAVYTTDDFRSIEYRGAVNYFESRNSIPFPEPVGGRHFMLFRFNSGIHIDELEAGWDQLLRPRRHRERWERLYARRNETMLLGAGRYPHEREKIGAGTQLVRTGRGWLVIYHAVGELTAEVRRLYGISEPVERAYTVSAALLAPDDPRRVLARTQRPIYAPSAPYELFGNEEYAVDVPAVVFPVGALVRRDRLLVYAGAGDKYVILLSCRLEKLVDYLWEHCRLPA